MFTNIYKNPFSLPGTMLHTANKKDYVPLRNNHKSEKNKSQEQRIVINGLKTVVKCCQNAEDMKEDEELTNPALRVGVLKMCTCVLLKDK